MAVLFCGSAVVLADPHAVPGEENSIVLIENT
jgi:hypothetical protein